MKNATKTESPIFDVVGFCIDFEEGNLTEEQTIAGFQKLVDLNLTGTLQGFYGRTAQALIEAGEVHLPERSG